MAYPLYHASFYTNRDSILTTGLMRDRKRLWNASIYNCVYLARSEDDAIDWMIDWYKLQIFDITVHLGNTYRERTTPDNIKFAMERSDHINDGLAVFEVDIDDGVYVDFRDANGSFLPRG